MKYIYGRQAGTDNISWPEGDEMMETTSPETKPSQEAWEAAAEKIYEKRRAADENVAHVHSVF